jgi:hypothetical protein
VISMSPEVSRQNRAGRHMIHTVASRPSSCVGKYTYTLRQSVSQLVPYELDFTQHGHDMDDVLLRMIDIEIRSVRRA